MSWRNAVRDIILIVVSILIAFALGAWWNDQLDRQRERAHLETLLASGELSLIQNHELSAMLSQWPVVSNSLHELSELQARNREELHIYLARTGVPVSRIAENLDWLNIPRSKFAFDPREVLADTGIETFLVSRAVRLGFLRDQYMAALNDAEVIISLLEKNLGSR